MASLNKKIKVLSATVKGSLHKAKDLPCQDYSKSCQKNNKLVAIVSDGAGSAKYSKISATIVGAFYHNNKRIFFHIGDGAALAFKKGQYNNFTISEPENGTFSCETYFYTMDDWKDSLRFTNFEQIDRIMLMTDGVTGFVFTNDFEKIHHSFFVPVVEFLENEERKTYAIKALKNTLNTNKAQKINSDDKTILWAKL